MPSHSRRIGHDWSPSVTSGHGAKRRDRERQGDDDTTEDAEGLPSRCRNRHARPAGPQREPELAARATEGATRADDARLFGGVRLEKLVDLGVIDPWKGAGRQWREHVRMQARARPGLPGPA